MKQIFQFTKKKKISLFCNVDIKNVIQTIDVKTIYEAPISFNNEKLDKQVLDYFKIKSKVSVNLNPWKKITKIVLSQRKQVNIAIIGKYVNLKDAYKSLDEALIHGGISNKIKVNLIRIESDNLKSLEFAIVENVQRHDLNAIEEAQGYQKLISEFAYDQEKVSTVSYTHLTLPTKA